MPGGSSLRVEVSPAIANRKCDISLWKEGDITTLGARAKKRYYKHKSAIEDCFTTDASLDEISLRHHISEESLQKLIQKCLMRHEDGTPWGFRALLPRVNVVDHTPTEEIAAPSGEAEDEVVSYVSPDDERLIIPRMRALEDDTAKHETIWADSIMPELPSTPIPPALQDGAETEEEETPEEIPAQGVEDAPNVGLEASQDVPMNGHSTALPLGDTVEEAPSDGQQSAEMRDAPDVGLETSQDVPMNKGGNQSAPTEAVDVIEEATAEQADRVSEVQWIILPPPVGAEGGGERMLSEERANIAMRGGDEPAKRVSIPSRPTAEASLAKRISTPPAGLKNPPVLVPHANGKARLRLPIHARARTLVSVKKGGQQRRLVRRRWIRNLEDQRRQKLSRGLISLVVALGLLIGVAMPLGAAIAAYSAYSNVRGLALDGVNHLLTVKSLLPVSKSDPFAALDAKKLQQAQGEFNKAESDFVQLQQLVNRPDIQSAIQQFAPEYGNSLGMAKSLVQVALDISQMGSELSGVGIIGANILHGSPLATGSTKPLISVADVAAIEGAMSHALYYIDDIHLQMSRVSITDLPISTAQKKQLTAALALLPEARNAIVQNQGLVEAGAWLLGVGQKRRFLVQTMDRAELRPGGGFTGQYGILEIENGRMAPFTLRDVALLDYAENGVELGRRPPPEYSWMNFGNWGLRDSNLSGDYPTTAQLNMRVFQEEGGGPIDGDIAFTTTFIGHIIDATGPIKVQEYGETITSKNLEERLHYYQQDFSAIAVERLKTGDNSHAVRKAFTGLLGKLLLDRVRHLPVKKLVDIAKGAVKDLQSRDLEVYLANPLAEGWLVDHGFSGAIDTFKNEDGFMVVQANLSISKASQYVHTTLHDDITLDAQGGATHNLTITLDYKQTGPVYGFDTYKDYIRVYAPETAQFLGGDGFDTGHALCKPASTGGGKGGKGGTGGNGGPGGTGGTGGTPPSGTVGCGQYKTSFPSDARYCPDGNYDLGVGYIADQGRFGALPIDSLGPPTKLQSDLRGRSMWGGLTWTPKNCISYITLSWYVPHAVKNFAGEPPYEILVQKQSGYVPTVELNVDTSAIKGLRPLQYSGNLVADRLFPLPVVVKKLD